MLLGHKKGSPVDHFQKKNQLFCVGSKLTCSPNRVQSKQNLPKTRAKGSLCQQEKCRHGKNLIRTSRTLSLPTYPEATTMVFLVRRQRASSPEKEYMEWAASYTEHQRAICRCVFLTNKTHYSRKQAMKAKQGSSYHDNQ